MKPKSTNRTAHETLKKEHYELPAVVSAYDQSRFGSPVGQWIKRAEEGEITSLIESLNRPLTGTAVDLPTGTGRMIPLLRRYHARVVAVDLSQAMLGESSRHGADDYLLADAADVPLSSASVDFVLSSRFIFHVHDLGKYMAETARILKPGGNWIFDAYHWTPKAWFPRLQRRWGGQMFTHDEQTVRRLASNHGLELLARRSLFFLPPVLYLRFPLGLVRWIDAAGLRCSGNRAVKSYYLLRKL